MEMPKLMQAYFFEEYFEEHESGLIRVKDTSRAHKIPSNIKYSIEYDTPVEAETKHESIQDELRNL